MSAGSAQNVEAEHFLRDIESRGTWLHCAATGQDDTRTRADMTLLYRHSRLDWRHRDPDGASRSSTRKDPSAAVAEVRNVASFRRHFCMGFMTVPVSQDLSPCSSAMAPRSRSCHLVEGGDPENEPPAGPPLPGLCPARQPPAKPKRHPSTRLSSDSHAAPPACARVPVQPADKRSGAPGKKWESGDVSVRKVPPAKPKRSPSTYLSSEPPSAQTAAPLANEPRSSQESWGREAGGSEEPVYIEMMGQSALRRAAAVRSSSESDPSEAIYEEMKCSLPEEAEAQPLPPKQYKPGKPVCSSSRCSKAAAGVTKCHSSSLPSSSSSTAVAYPASSCPEPPGEVPASVPVQRSTLPKESADEIPAPFPNLLQHRPPLLAFPQTAAAASIRVAIQQRATGARPGAVDTETCAGLAQPPPRCSSSATAVAASSTSRLPVLQHADKDSASSARAREDKIRMNGVGVQVGPGPGPRARSHSAPLPSSSQHFCYRHCHPEASHRHRSHRAEEDPVVSQNATLGCQTTNGTGGAKERNREHSTTPSPGAGLAPAGGCVNPCLGTAPLAAQHLSSFPFLYRSRTPLQQPHGLRACQAPPPGSPVPQTYPSAGLKRPPAYESPRGTAPHPLRSEGCSFSGGSGCAAAPPQPGTGSLSREGSLCGAAVDEGPRWATRRRLSLGRRSRESERDNGSAGPYRWNEGNQEAGSAGGQSAIPAWCGAAGVGATAPSLGARASGRSGLQLPCQTFPSRHRNGELGRLGRSASASGVRPGTSGSGGGGGGGVQRHSSLPRGTFSQPQLPSPPTRSQPHSQLHLSCWHLAQVARWQAKAGGGTGPPLQRDGMLLEAIEKKRCLCKEIEAQRRPERSLREQDGASILASRARTRGATRTAALPCRRRQAAAWDAAI